MAGTQLLAAVSLASTFGGILAQGAAPDSLPLTLQTLGGGGIAVVAFLTGDRFRKILNENAAMRKRIAALEKKNGIQPPDDAGDSA